VVAAAKPLKKSKIIMSKVTKNSDVNQMSYVDYLKQKLETLGEENLQLRHRRAEGLFAERLAEKNQEIRALQAQVNHLESMLKGQKAAKVIYLD
jgi:hypothetical protein